MSKQQPGPSRGRTKKRPREETHNVFSRVPATLYEDFDALCQMLPGKPSVSAMVAQVMSDYVDANREKLAQAKKQTGGA